MCLRRNHGGLVLGDLQALLLGAGAECSASDDNVMHQVILDTVSEHNCKLKSFILKHFGNVVPMMSCKLDLWPSPYHGHL